MQRALLLNGFLATGKSSVGRLVAERAGRPFVDLDEAIETRAQASVAEIFEARGEPGFRTLEREILDEVLGRSDAPVVALGGGALLEREVRLRALDRAVVVTLGAGPETIVRRAHADGPTRPLLSSSDPAARVRALLEWRAPSYTEAHATLSTDEKSIEAVAEDVLELWRRDPLAVAAGAASYAVDVGAGILEQRAPLFFAGASRLLLITDQNVFRLFGERVQGLLDRSGVRYQTVALEPGEEHKNPATLQHIWLEALASEADRKSRFIGFGGGVVTDTAGFAAATWMRGVPWLSAPTTLLAMVDASVGGKTAVDLPGAKNAVGAFWQPSAVLCDTSTLETEAPRGYRSALAEVVKTGLIGDAGLLELLEREAERAGPRNAELNTELVRRSIRVKARVVSQDEREGGLRAALNLGHTVGHALEACGGYGNLTHGEAVSLGLVAALKLGKRVGVTPNTLVERVTALLERLGLPVDLSSQPLDEAAKLLGHDKKRAGSGVRFVLAEAPGSIRFRRFELAELASEMGSLA